MTRTLRAALARNPSNSILLSFLVATFVILSLLLPDKFLSLRNFQSMGSQIPEFGLLSLAMMLAMLTGGIDLSIVAIANLSGIVAALCMKRLLASGVWPAESVAILLAAVVVALVVSFLCGLANGLLISRVGVSPIIATLGGAALYEGIGIIITSSRGIVGFPDRFAFVGNGFLWIFPMPFVIFAVAVAVFALVVNKTAFGLKVKMIGANPVAARFSGLDIAGTLTWVYACTGLLSGISSVIMMSRSNSAKSGYGSSYLLLSILIAVLGGVNPAGGFGTTTGLVMGIVLLQFLSSGFNIMAFSPFTQNVIRGALLLVVMIVGYLLDRHSTRARRWQPGPVLPVAATEQGAARSPSDPPRAAVR